MGNVQAQMQKIGDLPDGRTLYYAEEKTFTEPGFYIGDPDGDPVNFRVKLTPIRGKAEPRPTYWPIDVMVACTAACDDLEHQQGRQEALAIYAAASECRERDRKIPVPQWLEGYIVETG